MKSLIYYLPQSSQGNEIHAPNVYRYTKMKYIDDFFSSGKLRLNSFKTYETSSKEPENINQEVDDNGEGKNIYAGRDYEKEETLFLIIGFGGVLNLSTSTVLSKEMLTKFNLAAGKQEDYGVFQIFDPIGFACEIGNLIIELNCDLQGVTIGECEYFDDARQSIHPMDELLNKFNISRDAYESMPSSNIEEDFNQARTYDASPFLSKPPNILEILPIFFQKSKKHKHQSEFRFLWHLANLKIDSLDIKISNPAKFCRRIDSNHLS